jgi:AcrR family transcriptional regulator
VSKEKSRSYRSPAREQQASETQGRILASAETLFREKGFDGTTIEAVARNAGVAAPTIYAGFKSKRGVFLALLDKARFGEPYQALISEAKSVRDPRKRLEVSARIARQIYEAESNLLDLMRGAAAVSPELAALVGDHEARRRDTQLPLIRELQTRGFLGRGLDVDRAADVMWTLTSREIYRLLVVERQWTPAAYESWLAAALRREICEARELK